METTIPPTSTTRPQLGATLLQDGWITADQLDLALREAKRNGLMLGQTLVGLGFITEKVLAHYLAEGTQTGMVDLDEGRDRSYGRCINSHGDVAGERGGGPQRGFLYTDEFGMVNLDDLVVGTAEDLNYWKSNSVFINAINDSGQICGYVNGDPIKAFVLTPVPVE